jgi:hypothetical protein
MGHDDEKEFAAAIGITITEEGSHAKVDGSKNRTLGAGLTKGAKPSPPQTI